MYSKIRPLIPLLVASPLLAVILGSCKSLNTDLGRNVYERELEDTFEDSPAAIIATNKDNRMVVFRENSFVSEPPASSDDLEGDRSQGVQFLREATYRLAEARANSIEAMIAMKEAGVSEILIQRSIPTAQQWSDMFMETLNLSQATTIAELDLWTEDEDWGDEDDWGDADDWRDEEGCDEEDDWRDEENCDEEDDWRDEEDCDEEDDWRDEEDCDEVSEWEFADSKSSEWDSSESCEGDFSCPSEEPWEPESSCDEEESFDTEEDCDAPADCDQEEATSCPSEETFSFTIEVTATEPTQLAPSNMPVTGNDGSLKLVSATDVQLDIPRVVSTASTPAPLELPAKVNLGPEPTAKAPEAIAPKAAAPKVQVAPAAKPTLNRFTGTADGLDNEGKLAIRYSDDSRKGERVLLTVRCLDVQEGQDAPLQEQHLILLSPVTGVGTKSIEIPEGWGFVKLTSPDSKAYYAAFF